MSLVDEQDLFLQHVAKLIDKAQELGLVISAGEMFRTVEQQKVHIKAGRSKTMNSQHLKRLAIDLNFFIREPSGKLTLTYDHEAVRQLGAFWERLDDANRWGGNWSSFKDTPHFERREGRSPTPASAAVTAPASGRGLNLLTGTVGYRCDNQREDVEMVQRLLNLNADTFSLQKALVCDGIYGGNTRDAIKLFEAKIFGESSTDGKIAPRDSTLSALCRPLPAQVDATILSLLYLNASEGAITDFAQAVESSMVFYDINTPLRIAHFLAQIGHESGELRFREEVASGRAYEGRRDLGNIEPGDGVRFKGRGLIQLTGRANYKEYTSRNRFDKDVLENPELVATDHDLCVDVAGWYWSSRNLNELADQDKLEAVTRRINGGLNGLDHRRKLYLRAKALLGIV